MPTNRAFIAPIMDTTERIAFAWLSGIRRVPRASHCASCPRGSASEATNVLQEIDGHPSVPLSAQALVLAGAVR